MTELVNPFKSLKSLKNDNKRFYYSLPSLEEQGIASISRLPISIRIMLESLLRNCDGLLVTEEDILALARWNVKAKPTGEVPFIVARVILQDFTGVPLLVDLAAMRDAVAERKRDPKMIEPQVPVDLVIDHSVQVDHSGSDDAFMYNLEIEFSRNRERYEFLKWGQEAFETFKVVPPGIGIVHQVNLEHIATVVTSKEIKGKLVLYPDTLVGTDSHTTMINGLGVVGWGVGGIEAEAAMLGQPVSLPSPEVIGVHLSGKLQEGVTATDLTLRITELLRQEKVVGKFVEFYGEGASSLPVADRATIGNMAPEYGATMGFFPVDDKTLEYLKMTGRKESDIAQIKEYLTEQKLFGIPKKGEVDFTKSVELDLNTIKPCVSGPRRPQDRIDLSSVKSRFTELLQAPVASGGYGKNEQPPKICIQTQKTVVLAADSGGTSVLETKDNQPVPWDEAEMVTNRPLTITPGAHETQPTEDNPEACDIVLSHGSVVIAAITSCTNTSNPAVMLAAGLLAKKAVELGISINPHIKTSLAPGSRVVTDYLKKTDLQKYLDALGFQLVAYGCTTCIGNSGPLEERIEDAIRDYDLIAASVLSGNRNFEARIHSSIKANFLMSPPLVVAFAIAGRIDIDMDNEPLAKDKNGKPVFLRDIWPSSKEIEEATRKGIQPTMFQQRYAHILADNPVWQEIPTRGKAQYAWDKNSTYIQKPPFFDGFDLEKPPRPILKEMRVLALFGDSITTDHISPAGAFRPDSPAGQYLLSKGIKQDDFNSYGSRRGNHDVMMRGTFANVRIRNKLADGKEGGFTKLLPEGTILPIFDACQTYAERKTPLIIFTGKDYGMGSSRDWAAKGTALLGVKVVIARSFERIHRSNLIGMGVLPLQFLNEDGWESLGINGDETFSITGIERDLQPQQELILEIKKDGKTQKISVLSRLDTLSEVEYYQHGGVLPYVLREILKD
ncbi:MAG: aconitate hydratase [Parachlamydiaceae bacterium]|nr:aconitate hydratase [Parachlamydiaceae bacterium]